MCQCGSRVANKKITKIVHSGMQRTRQTAEIMAQHLGLPAEAVVEDSRIIELQTGPAYEGKTGMNTTVTMSQKKRSLLKVIPGWRIVMI